MMMNTEEGQDHNGICIQVGYRWAIRAEGQIDNIQLQNSQRKLLSLAV